MDIKIIQITSGKGPAECTLAVAFALREMIKEAGEKNLRYETLHRQTGTEPSTLYSATLQLSGAGLTAFIQSWQGALLWIAQSPYRRYHKRKNWFIGIHVFDLNQLPVWNETEIEFQTMRSSGPGGQNVNKVETAVRAIHLKSGVQVVANESRSQLQNKKLAIQKLKTAYETWQIAQLQQSVQAQWWQHHNLERGRPNRIYAGRTFQLEKINGNQ